MIDWKNAPEGTTHWASEDLLWVKRDGKDWYVWIKDNWAPTTRPEVVVAKPQHLEPKIVIAPKQPYPRSKYHVEIRPGVWVDVYDVLHAFGVTNPGDQHAIKKMLMPGKRGHKDAIQDRREAILSLKRAIELEQNHD